jgi:hypothetical protein
LRFAHGVLGSVVVLISLLLVAAPPASSEPSTEPLFPIFEPQGAVVDRALSPTGEFDFPTVLHAAATFDDPLDTYYLYTAPHNQPGGIWLFTADHPAGPWTAYENNPVIEADWQPYFSVSHVSSPHAFWHPDEEELFLYFHGENSVTRYATSEDGIRFSYGGEAITASELPGEVRETSYARVVQYEIPGRGNRYIMTFMDAVPGDGLGGRERRIRLAISQDARQWTVQDEPLITPDPAEGTSISGATYFPWESGHYIAYHGSSGNIFVTEVGAAFDQENHLGLLYRPSTTAPENGRAAAPVFVPFGDELHLLYEAGQRGSTTIAHAVADLTGPRQPAEPLPVQEADPVPSEPESDPATPTEDPEPDPVSDTTEARTFTDVRTSSSHYENIHILAAAGVTNGCGPWSDHTFCPTRSVTRAEMASFLSRAAGLRQYDRTRFVDVSSSSSHVPGISGIDRAGYTNGCGPASANTYCPGRAVTRAETATFLARILGLSLPSSVRYSDVSPTSSHAGAIEAIARAGLTNGCGRPSDNTFCPDRPVSRAEMASFLVRAFDLG